MGGEFKPQSADYPALSARSLNKMLLKCLYLYESSVGYHADISNICVIARSHYSFTTRFPCREIKEMVVNIGDKTFKPVLHLNMCMRDTTAYFKGDLRIIFSCVCGDQNRYSETKPHLFQTLIKWSLCLNPTRVKTKQSQHKMGN